MCDLRLHPLPSFNGDNVNLPVIDGVLCRVVFGAGQHMFALASRDILFGEEIFTGSQGLYFNKDRHVSLFCDDVDFTVGSPRVAGDDLVATSAQESG